VPKQFLRTIAACLNTVADKTARLWDLSAKDPAANTVILRGHQGQVDAVAISPDNRWVVTGSYDKTARLWLLQMKDLIDLARITVGRNFSNKRIEALFSWREVPQDL
jgi:WD40 repeat protein